MLALVTAKPADRTLQRACAKCAREDDERLQRSATPGRTAKGGFAAPTAVQEVLAQSGQPLDTETRSFFEPRFGFDFSNVRIHADERAAASARSVGARAYTVGSHIAFGRGGYVPGSGAGRALLAHELTHVVQQSPLLQRKPITAGSSSDRVNRVASLLERYANQADARLAQSASATQAAPVRAHLSELRRGIGRLRALAQQGDETASAAVVAGFAPQHLRAAGRVLSPVPGSGASTASPAAVAVAEQTPVELAAKSLTVDGADTAAEQEADRVASAVLRAQPVRVATGMGPPSVQRLLDGAAAAALEAQLPTVAAETGVADVALVGAGAAATEEAALGTAAVVAAAGGPPGWVIGLAIVAVVAVAAGAGYLYYRSQQQAQPQAQPQTQTQNQTQPQTQTQTQTQSKTAPKECEDQAKRLSTPDCRITASLQHAGNDPLADLFCEEKTNSPCEYHVESASGRALFDAIRGRDVYECKCGYQSLLGAIQRGERWAQRALDDKIEQIRRHIRVAKDCGLQYRVIVSNAAFGTFLRGLFGNEIDTIVEPFEPCD